MTVVSVHQPSFLPWLGFYNKVIKSDVFIIYDDCAVARRTVTTRTRLLIGGEAKWLSVPCKWKGNRGLLVRDLAIDEETSWRDKLLNSLRHGYAKHPCFRESYDLVHDALSDTSYSFALPYNVNIINTILEALGSKAKVEFSSSMPNSTDKASERLIDLVKQSGGSTYLCGDGSGSYLAPELFCEHGIDLCYTEFKHPIYLQYGRNDFVPGLSIFDALCNVGISGVKELLACDGF